jgi:hypothetical protein
MQAAMRRTLGTVLIWLGVLAWAPFLGLVSTGREVPILPFLAAHLTGVLGGWWLRNSANRLEGRVSATTTRGRRRKMASRILIYLGVLVWAPYLYLERILVLDVEIGPFLAAHLMGVLSGVALRLSVEWERWRTEA